MQNLFDDTLTVAQLNEHVRRMLAADPLLSMVRVSGEISNYKKHTSGHIYFTLKDDQAQVRCAMFRQHAYTLDFRPKDGDQVVVTASATLYAARGDYQLAVRYMEPRGLGELFLRFEALKRKLTEEGLFDESLKQPIPLFPAKIGLATSKTGAAVQDMLRILHERNPLVEVILAPCQVQGKGAEYSVIGALEKLIAQKVDLIIVGRGGGSLEDLWAFNEEALARAIFACPIPVISAVGHETDFTIADFVADARASTPSNAAEMAVPVLADLQYTAQNLAERFERAMGGYLRERRDGLSILTQRLHRHSPEAELALRRRDIAQMEKNLYAAMQTALLKKRAELRLLTQRLLALDLAKAAVAQRKSLCEMEKRLHMAFARYLREKRRDLRNLEDMLRGLSPDSVLGRGYAYVLAEGKPVTRAKQLRVGGDVSLRLLDGRADATIKQIEERE